MKVNKLINKGDLVKIIAPCGSLTKDRLITPIKYLESLGFSVSIGENILKSDRYLAGTIGQRIKDLHEAFINPNVKAIFIARGGFGSTQLLPYINYKLIAKHPKPFFGLSDSTALQIALYQKALIPSISGISLCSDFSPKGHNEFTKNNLEKFINTSEFIKTKIKPLAKSNNINGILIGGCLTLVVSLSGTPFQIKLKDKILFLEDVSEEPYRIDRMLTQLSQQKDFNKLKAIIFGEFYNCKAENEKHENVQTVLEKFASNIKVPVYTNLNYGHQPARLQIPIGINANISKNNFLTINAFQLD